MRFVPQKGSVDLRSGEMARLSPLPQSVIELSLITRRRSILKLCKLLHRADESRCEIFLFCSFRKWRAGFRESKS